MKTVSTDFTDLRKNQHPPPTKTKVTLIEYKLDGTEVAEYDITERMISFPSPRGELETKLNEFKASAINLELLEEDKYFDSLFSKANRFWAVKIEKTLDYGFEYEGFSEVDVADYTSIGGEGGTVMFERYDGDLQIYSGWTQAGGGKLLLKVDEETDSLVEVAKTTVQSAYSYIPIQDSDYLIALRPNGSSLLYKDLSEHTRYWGDSKAGDWAMTPDGEYIYWSDGTDKVHFQRKSDLPTHNTVECIQVTSAPSGNALQGKGYVAGYLYIGDRDNEKLLVYDATSPESVPYSKVTEVDLTQYTGSGNPLQITEDRDHNRIYVNMTSDMLVFDVTDPNNPVYIDRYPGTDYSACRHCLSPCKRYVVTVGRDDPYLSILQVEHGIKELDKVNVGFTNDVSGADWYAERLVDIDEDNRYMVVMDADSLFKIHLYKWTNSGDRSDWFTIFEGELDLSSYKRSRRTKINIQAVSFQAALDKRNAELVYDASATPLRIITGVNINSITGGFPGKKELHYRREERGEDEDDMHYLTFEGGEEISFTEDGTYLLTDKSGQQTIEVDVVTNDLPSTTSDVDDYFVTDDVEDVSRLGRWYEGKEIETLVGYLLDEALIDITDREINVEDPEYGGLDPYAIYIQQFTQSDGGKITCVEPQIPSGVDFFASAGTEVYQVSFDDVGISFSKTHLFGIDSYFGLAEFVSKIFRWERSGNPDKILLVCARRTTLKDSGGTDIRGSEYDICEGIIIFDVDNPTGTIVAKSKTDLDADVQYILARSFQEKNYGYHNDDRYFYFMYAQNYGLGDTEWAVKELDLSTGNTSGEVALFNTEGITDMDIYNFDLPSNNALLIYDSAANKLNAFFMRYTAENVPPQEYKVYIHEFIEGGGGAGDVEVSELTDSSSNCRGMNAHYATKRGLSGYSGYLFSTIVDGTQYQFAIEKGTSPDGNETGQTTIVSYPSSVRYGGSLPEQLHCFGDDTDGNQNRVFEITWNGANTEPSFNIEIQSYSGTTYPACHAPSTWLKDNQIMYLGLSEVGDTYERIFWVGITDAVFYVQEADFTEMSVREALNELAIAGVCQWCRPERDHVIFYSRGNSRDTITLDADLYDKDFRVGRQANYSGIQVENTYKEYGVLSRFPSNFNEANTNILNIDNRFAYSFNAPAIGKAYYDWFGYIRESFDVNMFLGLEVEFIDLIQLKLRDIDGNLDEQKDSIVVGIAFEEDMNMVHLNLVEKEGTELKPRVWVQDKWG
ncbi:MAG: hypothetical protein ABEK36_03990 [Candidatus Aenigmatarchaeota archaeon]